MNHNDQMKMKLLDELESEMDQFDSRSFADRKKNPQVAVVEEKTVVMPDDKPAEPVGQAPKPPASKMDDGLIPRNKGFYLNQDREKLLKDTELQSKVRDNDPIMMRGQWAKGRG